MATVANDALTSQRRIVYHVALEGVTALGKSTMLRFLHGKRLHGRPICSSFLEFSQLRQEVPEFREKYGNAYLEIIYTTLHLIRSLNAPPCDQSSNNDDGPLLHLTDRMPLANVVFDFLFHYKGQHSPRRIISLLRNYDNDRMSVSKSDRVRIRSFDLCFKIFAREMLISCPNYHVVIAVAGNASRTAKRLLARDFKDAPSDFDVRAYVSSQNILFRRAAELMGPASCTLLRVDDFLTVVNLLPIVNRFVGQRAIVDDGKSVVENNNNNNIGNINDNHNHLDVDVDAEQ